MSVAAFGLCHTCAHQRVIGNTRGSTFSMCTLGQKDPDWPKYPRMPVLRCTRYERRPGASAAVSG